MSWNSSISRWRDARVEPLLHPARQLAVAQQGERDALEVGHVGEALRSLVVGERGEQRAAEANHAQMLLARFVLVDLIGQVLERVLHLLDERQASANARGVVGRREQRRPGGGEARPRREEERGGKLFGRIPRQLAARRGELAHCRSKQIGPRGGRDRLGGMRVGRELGPESSARSTLVASTPASSASSNSTRRSQTVSSHTRS